MYKIEAVILKQGSTPVRWLRYVDSPKCRELIIPPRRPAVPLVNIEITGFSCVKCSEN